MYNRRLMRTRLLLLSLGLTFVCLLLEHQLLYKYLIVPQLWKWNHLPKYWWVVLLIPITATIVYIGFQIHNGIDLVVTAAGSSISTLFCIIGLLVFHQPGVGHDWDGEWRPIIFTTL